MAFTANYTADDAAPVIVDTGLKIVLGIATFATLIGLGIGLSYLSKIWKKVK